MFEDAKIQHQIQTSSPQDNNDFKTIEGDIEKTLRELLDLPDIQLFDMHMILQIFKKKYAKNYL